MSQPSTTGAEAAGSFPVAPPPVSRWGAIGLGVALAFFAVTAALSYRNARDFARTEELAAASRQLVVEVSELVSRLQAAETAERAYLATEDPSYRATYDEIAETLPEGSKALRRLAESGGREAAVAALVAAVDARREHLDRTIRLSDEQGFPAAREEIRSRRGQALTEKVLALATAFRREETSLRTQRNGDAARSLQFSHISDLLTAAIGLALAVAAFVRLRREFLARHAVAEDLDRQRELLQVTLHGLGEAVLTVDDGGRVRSLNAAAERLVGTATRDVDGRPLAEMLHLVDDRTRAAVECAAWETLRTGREARQAADTVLIAKDGTERHIKGGAAPIRTADGRMRGAVLTFRDVSVRKRAGEALRRSEERLTRALRAARAVAWEADLQAEVMVRSENAVDLFGLSPFTSIAEHLESVDPADRAEVQAAFARVTRGEADYAAEYRVTSPSGRTVWLADRGELRHDADGRPTHLVGVFIDITGRKQAEEAVREADARKDRFLATLAHELRNPLAPISNALQAWPFVKDDPAELDRLRETMARQVRQMTRLIDDLLDVSRITRGKLRLRRERADLKEILDAAVEGVRPLAAAKGQRLSVSVPEPAPALEGDFARLVQVFSNLLNNAAKYGDDGGRIDLDARLDGGRAVVSVADDGAGIPEEMLGRVFDLFAQADQTLDRSHGGLGIGLTLVKTLVELHGGTVEAKSGGPGRGSTFVVTLPVSTSAVPKPVADVPPAPAHVSAHRVLVVDDMRPSARTLGLMLEGIGQEVRVTHDGAAALAALDEFDAEVVLLDIAMPGMDGHEACRRIRTRYATSGPRPLLVALTGYGAEEDRRKAFEAGFDRHLVKPVGLDALKELLAGVDRRGGESPEKASTEPVASEPAGR